MEFKTETKDVYRMLRGAEQVERLSLIQYVWRQTLGYMLHPKIPKDVSSIADVATASGLWLCELSHSGSSFKRMDGFDVSPESFIPPRDLPAPINLTAADATQPPPEAVRGQYDVVHVRLINPGILHGDPSSVIKHCMQLLRPGGYLQWEEFDTLNFDVHDADGVEQPSNIEKLTKRFGQSSPKPWIKELPQTLESHGMIPIAVERKPELPWHHQQMAQLLARVMREIARAFLDVAGPPGSGDVLRAEADAGIAEAMKGSYPGFLFQVIVAQKPA